MPVPTLGFLGFSSCFLGFSFWFKIAQHLDELARGGAVGGRAPPSSTPMPNQKSDRADFKTHTLHTLNFLSTCRRHESQGFCFNAVSMLVIYLPHTCYMPPM